MLFGSKFMKTPKGCPPRAARESKNYFFVLNQQRSCRDIIVSRHDT